MSDGDVRGRFVWYDLMTTDPAASQEFYPALLGWGTQPWEGPMAYTMWTVGGVPMGGTAQLPDEAIAQGAPPHWLPYIGTNDVDATTARAVELGAKVLVPGTDIPDVGRFSVLADPQGAVFAAYTPAIPLAPEQPPAPGHFSWHELMANDYEAAFAFYSELFGWQVTEAMDMGPEAGIYQMYGRTADVHMGGMMNIPEGMPAPPHWMLYIVVEGLDAATEKVTAMGGQLLRGPMDVPGGDRVAHFIDGQGAAFALHELAKGSAE